MLSSPRRHTVTVVSAMITAIVLAVYVALAPGVGAEVRALVGLAGRMPGDTPGSHHAFLQTQADGVTPVGWDPCTPVRYVVDPAGAPDDWADLVDDAVAEAEAASTLTLVDEGVVSDRGFDDREARGPSPDPVLIGWADADEVDDLAGDVAGLGGAVSVLDGPRRHYTTGSVVLDTATYETLEARVGGDATERAILLHELGHVIGLDHVDDAGELMDAEASARTEWGPGDREGLAELGDLPCR